MFCQYSFCALFLFVLTFHSDVGYMVGEFPFALLLRVLRPSYLYAGTIVAFGVFATCCAATTSYAALLVLRLLVGFAEAGVQTAFLYLALWYKPNELAMRSAIFYGSTPLAGAVSGLISYGVQGHLNGIHGKASWQWLFILEGVPTIAWGILVACVLPAFPETVAKHGNMWFRQEDERRLILQRTVAGKSIIETHFQLS